MELKPDTILLAGGTGLVGALALQSLLHEPAYAGTIIAPTRRALAVSSPRLQEVIADFATVAAEADLRKVMRGRTVTTFISCLGTTIKKAGSRAAFIAVDRELVLRLAQLAHDAGARHVISVSSAGASRQSGNFYLRVKGEVEDALGRIGFDRVDILQPGLLLGEREDTRLAESAAKVLSPLLNFAMRGKLRRYRAIDAMDVAQAICSLATHSPSTSGSFSHGFDQIRSLALRRG